MSKLKSVLLLSILISSPQLFAVGVDMDGYFRSRYNLHYNLDLDSSVKPQMRNFADFRFRLNPEFLITDQIRVRTSFNIVDGVLGDAPFRGVAHSNPATQKDSLLNEGTDSSVGQPIASANMTNWVYGGVQAPDAASRTANLTPVQLRRAWLEWESDFGVFKAGRMPYHFGLGILGNAGDHPDQEIGSTRDRIVFETGFGNYYLAPGVGWQQEGILDRGSDDYYEYFFVLGRKEENQEIAMYVSYLALDKPNNAATNGSFVSTSTSYWILDIYGRNKFSFADVGVEAVLFAGDYLGKSLFALNAAAKAEWKPAAGLYLLTEVGFSSGTSQSDVNKNDIKTYAFNRDYNISMIVFEEALPGGQLGTNSTAPHSGAISNAIYLRGKVGYEVTSFFHPYLNWVIPYAAKRAPNSGGRFYGVEYNIITLWPFNEYVSGDLSFAHFLPGGVYDNVSESKSSILLRAGVDVRF